MDSLYCVTGATATGKTDLSLRIASKLNAEIVCCDALLVYRQLDIGTAKPTKQQQKEIPHHGLDLVDLHTTFNIADYFSYTKNCIRDILSRGKKVLVVGGSPFYLKGYFQPVVDDVPIPSSVRHDVACLETEGGLKALQSAMNALHPHGTGGLDMCNPRRVANALERCLSSGKTIQSLATNFAQQTTGFEHLNKHLCVVNRDADTLALRIKKRTAQMLKEGLMKEVESLSDTIADHPVASRAVGYRQVLDYLKCPTSIDTLTNAISTATLKLAKHQCKCLTSQFSSIEHHRLCLNETCQPLPF